MHEVIVAQAVLQREAVQPVNQVPWNGFAEALCERLRIILCVPEMEAFERFPAAVGKPGLESLIIAAPGADHDVLMIPAEHAAPFRLTGPPAQQRDDGRRFGTSVDEVPQ